MKIANAGSTYLLLDASYLGGAGHREQHSSEHSTLKQAGAKLCASNGSDSIRRRRRLR